MARSNTANVANYFTGVNTGLTAYPITMACWFYPFNLTSTSVLLAISNAAADSYHALQFDGSNAYGLGDNRIVHDCDAAQFSVSSTAVVAANEWNHAVAVLASATSRTVYLNGVAGTPNTSSRTPTSQNHLNVGVLQGSGGTFRPLDGRIAQSSFWNAALTAAEVLMLSKSVSALLVRSNNLQREFPLIGYGEERCRITRSLLTETGSMAQAEHCRVFYPSSPIIGKASSAAAPVLTADAGSYAVAGTAATPLVARLVAAAAGSFAVTGTAASLKAGLKVAAVSGSFAVTGMAAGLRQARKVTAASASFSVTGQVATLRKNLPIVAGSASFAVTGTTASLKRSRITVAASASYSLSGTAAALRRIYRLAAGAASYAVTGMDAGLINSGGNLFVTASAGSFAVTGAAAALKRGQRVSADAGAFSVAGAVTALKLGRKMAAGSVAFSLSGAAAALRRGYRVSAAAGAFTFAGEDITALVGYRLAAVAGSFEVTGFSADLFIGEKIILPDPRRIHLSGLLDDRIQLAARLPGPVRFIARYIKRVS